MAPCSSPQEPACWRSSTWASTTLPAAPAGLSGSLGSSGSAQQSATATQTHSQPGSQVFLQRHSQPPSDLHHLLVWSAIALVVMTLVSIPLGYYIAGRVLKPLRAITSTARAISARNLQERLALTGPDDEFKMLGDTLDGLLARLQTAFEAQRHFVANASHELRTPMTVERSLLQVALADPEPDRRLTARHLRESARRQRSTTTPDRRTPDARQQRKRTRPPRTHRPRPTRRPSAAQSLERHRPLAPYLTTTLQPASTEGDPRLIERLIANLIDNAIRHNTLQGHVQITTETRDQHAFLTVTNSGPVIPASEVQRLFQPFQRLNGTRTTTQHRIRPRALHRPSNRHRAPRHHHAHAQPDGGLAIEVSFPRSDRPRDRVGRQIPAPA